MRHALLLVCLLVLCIQSRAQIGFLAAANHGSATTAPAEGLPSSAAAAPVTIPSGTHLLMKLISPLHTTSSTSGSGVYLETVFPVVLHDRVVIPEHTRVLGTVQWQRRPGRVSGRAQMRLQFTQLILPDNHVLSISGRLQSLPGSTRNRTVDQEGLIEPVDQIDADVHSVVGGAAVGAIFGGIGGRSLTSLGIGMLVGGGVGLSKALFTRGDELSLPPGTLVEMVLKHPLTVQPPAETNGSQSQNAIGADPESGPLRQQSAVVSPTDCCDTRETVPNRPAAPEVER